MELKIAHDLTRDSPETGYWRHLQHKESRCTVQNTTPPAQTRWVGDSWTTVATSRCMCDIFRSCILISPLFHNRLSMTSHLRCKVHIFPWSPPSFPASMTSYALLMISKTTLTTTQLFALQRFEALRYLTSIIRRLMKPSFTGLRWVRCILSILETWHC